MRPRKKHRPVPASSALREPLDGILGTRGAVAVTRALAAARIPLSQSELARRAGMHLRGLPAILDGLEEAGVVAYVGRGRTRQVQLHQHHPLVQPLLQLFQAETNRWYAIQHGLREIAQADGGSIISAWIEGPVATSTDRFTDPIAVAILAEASLSLGMREGMQKRFNALQSMQHVVIAAQYYQRADLARFSESKRAELTSALLLYGPAPLDLSPKFNFSSEEGRRASRALQLREPSSVDRTREVAAYIAAKLVHDSELIVKAREFVDRRFPLAGEAERLSLLEWKGLLDSLTPGQVAAVLREDSARADALRQSLPFVGVLSDAERDEAFGARTTARMSRPKRARKP
jgi:hypothetical protein